MAQLIGSQVRLDDGQLINPKQGEWYDARRYMDGQLLAPGEHQPGQRVSNEVIAQTNPENVSYVQEQRNKYFASPSAQPSVSAQPSFAPSAPSATSPGGDSVLSGLQAPETLDIESMYANLHKESGVSIKEDELAGMDRAYTEQLGVLNNNPYLSEAGRVGREKALEDLHVDRTKNLRDEIAVKKADTETKLNLALKQLDINSQATQQAWDQFNSLLGAGALDNASGEDIAGLVRMTGIPSSMIYSAISVSRKSKEEKPNTSVIQSTADSGEVTVSVINTDTGEIIKQSSLGMIGNAQTGKQPSEAEQTQLIKEDLVNDIRGGITLDRAFQQASSFLDANDILRFYNVNSIYGPAKIVSKDPQEGEWDNKKLEQYGVKF